MSTGGFPQPEMNATICHPIISYTDYSSNLESSTLVLLPECIDEETQPEKRAIDVNG